MHDPYVGFLQVVFEVSVTEQSPQALHRLAHVLQRHGGGNRLHSAAAQRVVLSRRDAGVGMLSTKSLRYQQPRPYGSADVDTAGI
jgi:hypothetical protein